MNFTVIKKSENGFDKIILSDNHGTTAEILPACSAILHSFSVLKDGTSFNVIDNYDSAEDFKINVTEKGFKGTKLSPFVCRIKNGKYKFAGENFTIEKFYIRNNAIHGLLFDQSFVVVDEQANDDYASVSMKYEYRGSDKGYPFNYDCVVTYQLKPKNTLEVSTKLYNIDAGLIPIQDGWHPYFTLGGKIDDLLFEFQSKEMVEFDDDLVPTGKFLPYHEFGSLRKIGVTQLDNSFSLNFAECQPLCVLRNPENSVQLEISPDESYPYLQIYTPPHRNSIALENISSVPDAFNNGIGLKTLSSGESFTFTTAYKITLL